MAFLKLVSYEKLALLGPLWWFTKFCVFALNLLGTLLYAANSFVKS